MALMFSNVGLAEIGFEGGFQTWLQGYAALCGGQLETAAFGVSTEGRDLLVYLPY